MSCVHRELVSSALRDADDIAGKGVLCMWSPLRPRSSGVPGTFWNDSMGIVEDNERSLTLRTCRALLTFLASRLGPPCYCLACGSAAYHFFPRPLKQNEEREPMGGGAVLVSAFQGGKNFQWVRIEAMPHLSILF